MSSGRQGGSGVGTAARVRRTPSGRRVVTSVLVGAVAGVITAFIGSWVVAELVGWDAASAVFVVGTWWAVGGKDATATKAIAAREDASTPVADLVILAAGTACIVGAGFALHDASQRHGGTRAVDIGLAVGSVALSWAAVHTVFALRYAHLFYSSGGGVSFHTDDPPDYLDFAYLALTIGMTFQVSDTDLTSRPVRRTALRHALVSWLFGVVLLALVVNVLAGLLTGG